MGDLNANHWHLNHLTLKKSQGTGLSGLVEGWA